MIVPLIPLELLLLALALLGCALGALVNLAAYQLGWRRRAISPWSAPAPKAPARVWSDFLPVVGWLGLRRETRLHGHGFWLRPMAIELLCGGLLAGLYWWDWESLLQHQQPFLAADPQDTLLATPNLLLAMNMSYLSHAMLALVMIAMSLIDFDDKVIPDTLTVPGLLIGLLLATIYPWSLLPDRLLIEPWGQDQVGKLVFTNLSAPRNWPAPFGAATSMPTLLVALACWWVCVGGLMRRRWIARRGWRLAWYWFWGGLLRDTRTRPLTALGVVGSGLIAGMWRWGDEPHWAGLLSALVGALVGGGIIWLVRVVGSWAMRREAMGFGDVTLMAMIGAFVGWQGALLTFFISVFLALGLGLLRLLLRRDQEIPFGPFLCLGAFVVIVRWLSLWPASEGVFEVPWLLVALFGLCLLLMGAMLRALRWFRETILNPQ